MKKLIFLIALFLASFMVQAQTPDFHFNGVVPGVLASDPAAGFEGQFYWNSVSKTFRRYDGTSWGETVPAAALAGANDQSGSFKFSSSTFIADPGATYFRMGTANPATNTTIGLNGNALGGIEAHVYLRKLQTGDIIFIQQKNDVTKFIMGTLTADDVDNTGWYTLSYTTEDSGSLFDSEAEVTLVIFKDNFSIDAGDITTTELEDLPAETLMGRDELSAGKVEHLTVAEVNAMLGTTAAADHITQALDDDNFYKTGNASTTSYIKIGSTTLPYPYLGIDSATKSITNFADEFWLSETDASGGYGTVKIDMAGKVAANVFNFGEVDGQLAIQSEIPIEEVDQGNGDGYINRGRNETYFANIGNEAWDFSRAVSGTTHGAGGFNSVAFGTNVKSSGSGSSIFGLNGDASGSYSFGAGSSVYPSSYGEAAFGTYGTVVTPTSAFSYNVLDRAFSVGIGPNGASKENGFEIWKDGTVLAPGFSNAEIDAAGTDALITKGYGAANYGTPDGYFITSGSISGGDFIGGIGNDGGESIYFDDVNNLGFSDTSNGFVTVLKYGLWNSAKTFYTSIVNQNITQSGAVELPNVGLTYKTLAIQVNGIDANDAGNITVPVGDINKADDGDGVTVTGSGATLRANLGGNGALDTRLETYGTGTGGSAFLQADSITFEENAGSTNKVTFDMTANSGSRTFTFPVTGGELVTAAGAGDNLGDHEATQNLVLGGFGVTTTGNLRMEIGTGAEFGIWDTNLAGDALFSAKKIDDTANGATSRIGQSGTLRGQSILSGNNTTYGGYLRIDNASGEDTTTPLYAFEADENLKIWNYLTLALEIDDTTSGITAPGTSEADITTLGAKALITKEYADTNYSGSSSDLVDDLTPQLGGDLDVNSNEITSTESIVLGIDTDDDINTVESFTINQQSSLEPLFKIEEWTQGNVLAISYLGENDARTGTNVLYGSGLTNKGGATYWYNAAPDDTTVDYWGVRAEQNLLFLSGLSDVVIEVDDATYGVTIPGASNADINALGAFAVTTKNYVESNFVDLTSTQTTITGQKHFTNALNYFGNSASSHLRMYGNTPSMEAWHSDGSWAALRNNQLIFHNTTSSRSVFLKPPATQTNNYDVFLQNKAGTLAYLDDLELTETVVIQNPGASEDRSMFFTNKAITISEIRAVLIGSATPSVTWTIRFDSDRSATGTEVITSGQAVTSTTTGTDVTIFSDATIPADSFVWVETTAQSGTVGEMMLSMVYLRD